MPPAGTATHDLGALVALALAEDLGSPLDAAADRTTGATVPSGTRVHGRIAARADGVLAGCGAAEAALQTLDPAVRLRWRVRDGRPVRRGSVVADIDGPARAVLAGERTALNLLCHLSGIASLTARYVAAVAGTGCVVRDTRKTLPGLRALQKEAVRAGGGHNHRYSLTDALLVKDNHVAAAGGLSTAVRAAVQAAGRLPVQVEVDTLAQLDEALAAGAAAVLLDNFSLDQLRAGVTRCRGRTHPVFVEASGGVTLDTAAAIAATGVDAIAVGALTHSAPALDLGLDLVLDAGPGAG